MSSDEDEASGSSGSGSGSGSTSGSNSEEELSPDRLDKLLQLQSLTGIEDIQICKALLNSKDWDLEATVREHLGDPAPAGPSRPAGATAQAAPIRVPPTAPDAHNHRVIRPQSRATQPVQGVFGAVLAWGSYLVQLPVRLPYTVTVYFLKRLYSAGSYVFGLSPLTGSQARRALSSDAVGDVSLFVGEFDAKYGNAHPPFKVSSYMQALDEAKKELKFIVIYLHSSAHQDTDAFCRQSLCSKPLADFFSEQNMLLWGCSVEKDEGYRVSQALRESTYPFMAVIVLRQGKMMTVGRIEGAVLEPERLKQQLAGIIRDNEAYVVAERAERAEREMNQSIREEQDRIFQETLKKDQERERLKREAEEAKRRAEEEEQRRVHEEQMRKERIHRLKIELASSIPEEPAADAAGAVRVLVKLPHGQRLERRFLQKDSLKCLYFYVFCHPDSPDDFDITTNFPRKVLACKPPLEPEQEQAGEEPVSFEEAGITGSVMLFVNDLDA